MNTVKYIWDIWQYDVQPVLEKEFIHIFTDRLVFLGIFLMPILELLIFGFALNNEVRDVSTYVLDQSHSNASRELINRIEATGYFEIKRLTLSKKDLIEGIRSGDAQVGIVILPDYANTYSRSHKTQVQILIDGSDSNVATQTGAAFEGLTRQVSLEYLNKQKQGYLQGADLVVESKKKYLFNPGLKSSFFIVPGIIGIVIFVVICFLCSLSLVKEKERGTYEQLLITPISSFGIILGKIIPYLLLGFFVFNLLLIMMYTIFGIVVQGDLWILEIGFLSFMFCAIGISLLCSLVTQNQIQAGQLIEMTMLPSILISGFVFPFHSMHPLFQSIGNFLPITHFLRISRGVILRGAELSDLMLPLIVLGVYGLVLFGMSLLLFQKELK